MDEFKAVAQTRDIGPGDVTEVEASDGHAIALTNIAQTYYAVDATCPVDGTNLARAGHLDGDFLRCPGDETAFDVRTGVAQDPDKPGLQRYAVRVELNEVKVGPPLD